MTPQPPPVPAASGSRRRVLVAIAAPLVVLAVVVMAGGLPVLSGVRPATTPVASSPADPSSAPATASAGSPATTAEPSAGTPEPTLAAPSQTPAPPSPRADGDYLLLSRAELMARPTNGPAWDALLAIADGPTGRPRLRDQDARHGLTALAVALVYARTGETSYRDQARREIMRVIGSESEGANNAVLALGRQLGSYVLAADFIDLDGDDDERFREWLAEIRTKDLGGHGRWTSLVATHQDSANNWGAFAGASRIAASLYLDDRADVAIAAQVLRGFLGDTAAWHSFQPVDDSASWACDERAYVPVNPPCERGGIDLDGAIVRDISRDGDREWPPGDTAIRYTLESLQGLMLQAELLTVAGYGDAWSWSDEALRRAADLVTRSGEAGGETWNRSQVSFHVPWLFNARYDLGLHTEPAGQGRVFGYTDWLYGD